MTRRRRPVVAAAAITALAVVVGAMAWVFWPAAPGIDLRITVSNASSSSTPELAIVGPSARTRLGMIAPGESRTVRFRDTEYGDVVVELGPSGQRLGLLSGESDLGYSGVSSSAHVVWRGSTEGAWAEFGRLRYQYRRWLPSTLNLGGVWPLESKF